MVNSNLVAVDGQQSTGPLPLSTTIEFLNLEFGILNQKELATGIRRLVA